MRCKNKQVISSQGSAHDNVCRLAASALLLAAGGTRHIFILPCARLRVPSYLRPGVFRSNIIGFLALAALGVVLLQLA